MLVYETLLTTDIWWQQSIISTGSRAGVYVDDAWPAPDETTIECRINVWPITVYILNEKQLNQICLW